MRTNNNLVDFASISTYVGSESLVQEVKDKHSDIYLNFAYTDYGGSFLDKVIISLANCSAMKSIIREAAKLLYKYDGITPTRQEKQQAAKEHAKYILDGVQYSIQKRQ